MTHLQRLIRRELLNIEVMKTRRVECQNEKNFKRADECHKAEKSMIAKFNEALGNYWQERDLMLIEYGLLTVTSNSHIKGDLDSVDWYKEFSDFSNQN